MNETSRVRSYLESLPPERRAAMEAVREVILANLPDGYVETFNWGMISYEIPLEASGKTYNGKPLMYAALGNQKHHMGLYLCGLDAVQGENERFVADVAAAGKKLDMGKACVRFRDLDDLALDAVGRTIAAITPASMIAASGMAPRKKP